MNAKDASEYIRCTVGLAALLSTLLVYSVVVTPFQRFPGLSIFVGTFAQCSLTVTLVCACAICAYSFSGRSISERLLRGTAAVTYLAGVIIFVVLATFDAFSILAIPISIVDSVLVGVGCCLLCLVWGRIFKRFGLRRALLLIASASAVAGVVACVMNVISIPVADILFLACAVLTVVLSFTLAVAPIKAEQVTPKAVGQMLRSFASVYTAPALGLVAFAFIMGSMRNVFTVMFDPYACGLLTACGVVALCTMRTTNASLGRLAYQRVVMLLCVVVLAVGNVTIVLLGGSVLNAFTTMLLYTFTAMLTIGTLCAVAHAAEFASDLVFSSAVAFFALASLAGLICAEFIPDDMVGSVSFIVTAVYAVAVAAMEFSHRGDGDATELAEGEDARTLHAGREDRCAALAEEFSLTKRELEILRYLADGHSGAYISQALFISPNTARTHIHNIYRKLDASSREDILRLTKP